MRQEMEAAVAEAEADDDDDDDNLTHPPHLKPQPEKTAKQKQPQTHPISLAARLLSRSAAIVNRLSFVGRRTAIALRRGIVSERCGTSRTGVGSRPRSLVRDAGRIAERHRRRRQEPQVRGLRFNLLHCRRRATCANVEGSARPCWDSAMLLGRGEEVRERGEQDGRAKDSGAARPVATSLVGSYVARRTTVGSAGRQLVPNVVLKVASWACSVINNP